jgi:hypothetical protein
MNGLNKKHRTANTRLWAMAAEVQLAGFAPAFTLSLCDSERSRKPPNAHSLGRQTAQKHRRMFFEEKSCLIEK